MFHGIVLFWLINYIYWSGHLKQSMSWSCLKNLNITVVEYHQLSILAILFCQIKKNVPNNYQGVSLVDRHTWLSSLSLSKKAFPLEPTESPAHHCLATCFLFEKLSKGQAVRSTFKQLCFTCLHS